MKSTSESLSHPETSNGKATGGNCVVERRGGAPEKDLRLLIDQLKLTLPDQPPPKITTLVN